MRDLPEALVVLAQRYETACDSNNFESMRNIGREVQRIGENMLTCAIGGKCQHAINAVTVDEPAGVDADAVEV